MILAILACKIREASNIIYVFNWIKLCSSLPQMQRERERCVCARNEQKLSRRGEREMCVSVLNRNWADAERQRCVSVLNRNWAERERERCVWVCWTETEQRERECVCARPGKARPSRSSTDSRRLNKVWALYFRGKKSLKWFAMLLSWQHCASPFLQLRVEPRVKQKIRTALITH